jgi:hypothetical protein
MEFTGILIGVFATTFFFIILIGAVWLVNLLHNQKYNKFIRINNKTAGKDVVEWYKGAFMKHKTLGDVYFVPALKKEDRQYIPFTGSAGEFPTNKPRQKYVPLTYHNGTYAPESYEHTEQKEIDVIVKRYGELTPEEYLALSVEERQKNKKLYKVQFIKELQTVTSYIIKPTKYSMRNFNLDMDTSIKDDFFLNPSFFERYGGLLVAGGFVMMGALVAIVMIVFAYQWGVDISQNTPAWVSGLVEGLSNNGNIAPPTN